MNALEFDDWAAAYDDEDGDEGEDRRLEDGELTYALVGDRVTWYEAAAVCDKAGGRLAGVDGDDAVGAVAFLEGALGSWRRRLDEDCESTAWYCEDGWVAWIVDEDCGGDVRLWCDDDVLWYEDCWSGDSAALGNPFCGGCDGGGDDDNEWDDDDGDIWGAWVGFRQGESGGLVDVAGDAIGDDVEPCEYGLAAVCEFDEDVFSYSYAWIEGVDVTTDEACAYSPSCTCACETCADFLEGRCGTDCAVDEAEEVYVYCQCADHDHCTAENWRKFLPADPSYYVLRAAADGDDACPLLPEDHAPRPAIRSSGGGLRGVLALALAWLAGARSGCSSWAAAADDCALDRWTYGDATETTGAWADLVGVAGAGGCYEAGAAWSAVAVAAGDAAVDDDASCAALCDATDGCDVWERGLFSFDECCELKAARGSRPAATRAGRPRAAPAPTAASRSSTASKRGRPRTRTSTTSAGCGPGLRRRRDDAGLRRRGAPGPRRRRRWTWAPRGWWGGAALATTADDDMAAADCRAFCVATAGCGGWRLKRGACLAYDDVGCVRRASTHAPDETVSGVPGCVSEDDLETSSWFDECDSPRCTEPEGAGSYVGDTFRRPAAAIAVVEQPAVVDCLEGRVAGPREHGRHLRVRGHRRVFGAGGDVEYVFKGSLCSFGPVNCNYGGSLSPDAWDSRHRTSVAAALAAPAYVAGGTRITLVVAQFYDQTPMALEGGWCYAPRLGSSYLEIRDASRDVDAVLAVAEPVCARANAHCFAPAAYNTRASGGGLPEILKPKVDATAWAHLIDWTGLGRRRARVREAPGAGDGRGTRASRTASERAGLGETGGASGSSSAKELCKQKNRLFCGGDGWALAGAGFGVAAPRVAAVAAKRKPPRPEEMKDAKVAPVAVDEAKEDPAPATPVPPRVAGPVQGRAPDDVLAKRLATVYPAYAVGLFLALGVRVARGVALPETKWMLYQAFLLQAFDPRATEQVFQFHSGQDKGDSTSLQRSTAGS
ncbi:hypothetical protein JL722_2030 [Aureococcus anophagefferens]|nr:hypothetical protein JL722_2030 [Aureococcus anophagefferens]